MIPNHWTQNKIKINNARLNYYRTGDRKKPPLVLVHGFSDSGLCWLKTAIDLESDFDVIMPDARGHGQSERINHNEPMDMASDLAGMITKLDLKHPVVVGHSMGAMAAFQMSVRCQKIPRALVLEDPPWWQLQTQSEQSQSQNNPFASWIEGIQRLPLEKVIAQTRLEHPTWPEWTLQTWCPAKMQLDTNIFLTPNIEGNTWLEEISRLSCPTLIVTADPQKGGIVTPEIAVRAKKLNSLCQVVNFPGIGHHIRFEDYQKYMNTLRTFFSEL